MIVLLADSDINGQVDRLVRRMQLDPWHGFWNDLQVSHASFADVGLFPSDSDEVVWYRCQEKGLVLLTGNRNDDGPESLENTIRTRNTPSSPPVFTVSDARRVLVDRDNATDVIWSLYEYLYKLDLLRGVGRLYLP